jgi:pimeloyl-ACP methyl ester carboxylesterase
MKRRVPPIDVGRASGIPFVRVGQDPRIVVLAGIDALFRPLDRSARSRRRAKVVARLLSGDPFVLLGYGEIPQPCSLDTLAEQAARAIGELVPKPELVVGLSFGGFIAMRLAAARPELAPRLLLLASAHAFSPLGWRRIERQRGALAAGDLNRLIRQNAVLFRRPWYNALMHTAILVRGRRLTVGFRPALDLLQAYRMFSPDSDWNADVAARISAPTLIIGGERDQFFGREQFVDTARRIEGARAVIFPRETHMLPIERTRTVARTIADWRATFV